MGDPLLTAKFLVVGDTGVGKATLIERLNFEGCTEERLGEPSSIENAWVEGRGGGERTEVLEQDLDFKVTSKRMDITRDMIEEEGDLSEPGETMPEAVDLRFWDVNPLLCGGSSVSARQMEVFRNTSCTLILFDITSHESYMAAREKYFAQSKQICPEAVVILVASKSDLALKMAVEENEVEEFCVKEGILYVFLSTATSVGLDLIENMIKIQILNLLRCHSVDDDLYDLQHLLVIEDGDVEATYFMDHHDDDHYKRGRDNKERLIVDEKFIETVGNLAVPERDFNSIEDMVGNFWGANQAKNQELDLSDTSRDGLSIALESLQAKVETIIRNNGVGEEGLGNPRSTNVGTWNVEDISNEELNEAFVLLGRANPRATGEMGSSGGGSVGSGSAGERVGGGAGEGGRRAKGRRPELRINVGTKGGITAPLEIWEGEDEEVVARQFIRRNKLPLNQIAVNNLAQQIRKCREKKKEREKGGGDMRVVGGNGILGRLEVKLRNGQKRAIVVRKGDDPRIVVRAFANRHKIGFEEEKGLVGLLRGALGGT